MDSITESPPTSHFSPSLHRSHSGFPIIAVAVIGILATAFLLVSYYIFVIKCCLNWHRIDLLQRLSASRRRRGDDPLVADAAAAESRGLEEAAIRSIPILQFEKGSGKDESERKDCECAVCLNEFQEKEKLRIIPICGHVFHIDCIDVWLQSNANCPLCRNSISADEIKLRADQILAPIRSPPDGFTGRDEDYVVIELESETQARPARTRGNFSSDEFLSIIPSPRKLEPKIPRQKASRFSHGSSMGDECIDSRKKDEQFSVQPIRRSFSMDSADDRHLCSAVQEIIQQQWRMHGDVTIPIEGCSTSSRTKKSFFSFGHGRSSRNAIQPLALESQG